MAGVSPGSSCLYGNPFHCKMTSHQALGALAKACATGIPGKADEDVLEPAGGGRSPRECAELAIKAPQTEDRYRWRIMPEAGRRDEPRPAEEAAADRLHDWLSRWTGPQPMR